MSLPPLASGPHSADALRPLLDTVLGALEAGVRGRGGPLPAGGPEAVAARVREAVGEVLPEHGDPGALAALVQTLAEGSADPADPLCAAHLHCPPLAVATAADLAASALNPSLDSWDQAPAASELETLVTGVLAREVYGGPGAGTPRSTDADGLEPGTRAVRGVSGVDVERVESGSRAVRGVSGADVERAEPGYRAVRGVSGAGVERAEPGAQAARAASGAGACRGDEPADVGRAELPLDACRGGEPVDVGRAELPLDARRGDESAGVGRAGLPPGACRGGEPVDVGRAELPLDARRGDESAGVGRAGLPPGACRGGEPVDVGRAELPLDARRGDEPVGVGRPGLPPGARRGGDPADAVRAELPPGPHRTDEPPGPRRTDTPDPDAPSGNAPRRAHPLAPDALVTTGGTESNHLALLLAREAHGGGVRLVCGANAHHSLARAAWLLGLPEPVVVPAPAGVIDPVGLEEVLSRLTGPLLVAATAGTTDAGLIDPLPEIAARCAAYGARLHVDAAYGGGLLFSARHRGRLAGIEAADTVTLDLHKLGWQPVAAGLLAVRDAADLTALHQRADYLNADDDTEAGLPDLLGRSLRTTRRPDVLKIAVTLKTLGRTGLGALVDQVCDLAQEFADRVTAHPAFELYDRPVISTVLFRPRNADVAAVRRTLLDQGRAVLGRARTDDGRLWLKATLLNPHTGPADLDRLLKLVEGTTPT